MPGAHRAGTHRSNPYCPYFAETARVELRSLSSRARQSTHAACASFPRVVIHRADNPRSGSDCSSPSRPRQRTVKLRVVLESLEENLLGPVGVERTVPVTDLRRDEVHRVVAIPMLESVLPVEEFVGCVGALAEFAHCVALLRHGSP